MLSPVSWSVPLVVREVVEVDVVVVGRVGVVSVVRVTTAVFWRLMKRGIRSSAARGINKIHQGKSLPWLVVATTGVEAGVATAVSTVPPVVPVVGVPRSVPVPVLVPTVAVASWNAGFAAAEGECAASGRMSRNATTGTRNALSTLGKVAFIFSSN